MQTNEKQISINRKDLDNNIVLLYTSINMLKRKRKSNYEHLKNVRNMSPEDIAKDKNMMELNDTIRNLKEVEDYFIEHKKELNRENK